MTKCGDKPIEKMMNFINRNTTDFNGVGTIDMWSRSKKKILATIS
jgi:hypothetical protein